MGGATVDASKYVTRPDPSSMYQLGMAQSAAGMQGLQQQGELLRMFSQMPPPMQQFDRQQVSREAAELGMENLQRSKEFERLVSPETAKMRSELGARVAEATDPEATQRWATQMALKSGLMRGVQTGISPESSIARSAMFDTATEAGRQARLQNLALQQGYLAQTAAPIGGLDPSTAIAAEQAAKAQNLEAMRRWQENVMGGQLGFAQSQSDWINQSLGNLANIGRTQQQDVQNYQQALLGGAAQSAASKNAITGSLIGAGGAAVGLGAAAAIMV